MYIYLSFLLDPLIICPSVCFSDMTVSQAPFTPRSTWLKNRLKAVDTSRVGSERGWFGGWLADGLGWISFGMVDIQG